MKLTINLASEDFRKTKVIRLLLWVSSALLVGILGWQVRTYLAYQEEAGGLRADRQKVEESLQSIVQELRTHGLDTSEARINAFSKKVSILNNQIAYKAFSWTLFLNELESTVPDNISVARLEPRFPDGLITLVGKAISLKDLTQLIIRLEDSKAFSSVFLRDQNTDQEGFIEFTVEFKYRSQKRGA